MELGSVNVHSQVVAPSLLACDVGRLRDEIKRITRAGAHWLHLDVMDGHFVQNLTFGPNVATVVRQNSKLFLDAHLMCAKPEILLQSFKDAGVDQLTVHVELGTHVDSLLWKIKAMGLKCGLAVNPPTSMECVSRYLKLIDTLLIMTVNPGFGGQPFIPETITKILWARAQRAALGLKFRIQVDGGITDKTGLECANAGADTFVSGTFLLKNRNLRASLTRFQRTLAMASNPSTSNLGIS